MAQHCVIMRVAQLCDHAHQAPRVVGGLAVILCGKRRRVVEAAAAQQPRVVGGAAGILCGKQRMEVKEGQGLEQSLFAQWRTAAAGRAREAAVAVEAEGAVEAREAAGGGTGAGAGKDGAGSLELRAVRHLSLWQAHQVSGTAHCQTWACRARC